MYDTDKIYDQAFSDCFNSIKQYREQWNYMPGNRIIREISRYTEIWDSDTQQYTFIQQQAKKHITYALIQIMRGLLNEYKCPIEYIDIQQCLLREFFQKESRLSDFSELETEDLLAFVHIQNNSYRVLYIFREYGLPSRITKDFAISLRTITNSVAYREIAWVDKDAYTEVLNHNDNVNDPGRGTNTYSFDLFVRRFFGKDELDHFHQRYSMFKKQVLDYCGITLVKTLRPNVIASYRSSLFDTLSSFDYDAAIARFSTNILCEAQRNIINTQFVNEQFGAALVSSSGFAKCFMTAEWLYSSLRDSAEAIDLTAISMGYFKAVEQFMYAFIGLHTSDKDGKHRAFPFFDGSQENWITFTDQIYKQKKKNHSG